MRCIIFFIVIMAVLSLDYKQYCKIPEEKCKNTLLGLECFKVEKDMKCQGRFRAKCDLNYCGVNQSSCADIHPIMKTFKTLNLIKHKVEINRHMDKFMTKMGRNFQLCPHATYKLNSNEFCLKSQNNGRKLTRLEFRYGGFYLIRSAKFKCSENLFDCDENVCSKDKASCDTLKTLKITDSKALSFIKDCI